ncbi:prolipoprotein diacylglyceryl transferase [Bacteriovoracaceae bacterium]|nr:prolipoprotein diacylglyceryl transferase [Bacteriovoracaceae bacterium]
MVVDLDPVIFSIGPLSVRWYGFMYVVGFLLAGFLLKKLIKRGFFKVAEEKIDSLITTMIICMFIGARFVYVFVYNWDYYANNPSELLAFWQGGLSFHGAIIGLLVGGYIFAKRNKVSWPHVMDNVCLAGTPGLFFGRMGNFINGELYGRVTDSPLGLIFPAGGPYPRHPSQLYEGVMEGIVLTIILWVLLRKVKFYGIISSAFLIGYGVFRYFIEFFREADAQLGYYFGGTTTMGQILCLIMIIVGLIALKLSYKYKFEN